MTYLWEPTAQPKAIVIFFHSLNGHIGMCGELARQLVGRGIIMAGYDFKNFGQSEGPNRGML
jgi:alpha-beta hydrolase superfamily lysophospholipase